MTSSACRPDRAGGACTRWRDHTGRPVALAFSPDGKFVASASTDGTGRVWRTADWGLASALTGHTNALKNVSFSADGEHVVTTGKDNTARVSHAETGDELFVLSGHRGWVESAAFSGGAGSPIVTASQDESIRIWDGVFQPELTELAPGRRAGDGSGGGRSRKRLDERGSEARSRPRDRRGG